jgi:predicted HicB family RNase H-like nuclease
MDVLSSKGYEGSIERDRERGLFRGKLLLVSDLVTYQAATVSELQKEFEAAVDDYLETCRTLGRAAQEPRAQTRGKLDET